MATKKSKKPSLTVVNNLTPSKPDSKFGPHGQALWDLITNEYDISDAGGVALLELACHAQDRVEQLAAQISIDGPVIYAKGGMPKSHPALRDELQGRAFIARTIQRLGLDVEAIKPVGRPSGFSPR